MKEEAEFNKVDTDKVESEGFKALIENCKFHAVP